MSPSRVELAHANGKNSIDLGLAVMSSVEHRLPQGEGREFKEMAAYCGCSYQRLQQICNRAMNKMRTGLAEQGISKSEALMVAEMMSKQGAYRSQYEDKSHPRPHSLYAR